MGAELEDGLASRYAGRMGARAASFARAQGPVEALLAAGAARPGDAVVAFPAAPGDVAACERAGVSLRVVLEPSAEALLAATGEHARTFWLVPAIGGCGLRVPALRDLACAARAAGAVLAVDNSLPTCFGCLPLAQGAQLAVERVSSLWWQGGVEDCLAVAVARSRSGRKRPEDPLAEELYRDLAPCWEGLCALDGHEERLVSQALESLPARMQAAMDAARALAEFLRCHPAVGAVRYPGLPAHPDHAAAASTLLHGFGPVVEFEVRGRLRRGPCVLGLAPVSDDEAAWRLAVSGIDDPVDVADSLDQALRMFCKPPEP